MARGRRHRLALVTWGLALACLLEGPRLDALRAEHVTYARHVEDFDAGRPRAPGDLVSVEGFVACTYGWCLRPGASGRLTLAYPRPGHTQVVARLWFYAPPPVTSRLAVSTDEGRTWREAFRNRHLNNEVVDLSPLLVGAAGPRLWLAFEGQNPTAREALVLDRLDLVTSDSPPPARLPNLPLAGRVLLAPVAIFVGARDWLGRRRAMILAGLLPALMVAAAIAFPALRALAGPGAWLLLIGSAVAATARWARTGLRGGRGRAAVATTAAACAISGAVSLRWAEFLTTYRFPLEADAATYLDYMQRFTWGSPDHGLYSASFGPWEPLFVALGNGFFRLTGASHLALRLLTIGLAILGVCLTYLAGRRFFRSRLIGALAAGLLAGSPYLVFDAARGYRTPLELCLFLGVALACWTARPGMSWVRTLLAGGLAAGLCLTRLPYLPAVLVVIIAGVWKGAGSARRALPGAAVAIGLVAVLVVPLLVAGQAKHGHYFYGALGRGALTWLVLEGEQLGATGDDTRLVWRSMSVSEVLHGLDRVMRTAGGWPRTLARGCALALRDVAVLGAQRAYWFALLALGLLLASPYRFVLAAALLSIAHVAPFYAIGAQTIPDAVAFPADPGIYHSFYGGDLFAYGVISRYRHLAQGAPFAALAAAWLTVTAATGVGRLLWHRTRWRWKPVGAVRPREAPRPL